MKNSLNITIAQLNFMIGDIHGNCEKIITTAHKARDELQSNLIIFPELALTGYPPEDLLLREDFHAQVKIAIEKIQKEVSGIDIIFGYPKKSEGKLFNNAMMIQDGKIVVDYSKQCLPNYGVFDERRYFSPGNQTTVLQYCGIKLGIIICEDLWFAEPTQNAVKQGAELIICINASPFDMYKLREREKIMMARINENQVPIIYSHGVGGQDELIFDGRSIVMDSDGKTTHLAPAFAENLLQIKIEKQKHLEIIPGLISPKLSDDARTYHALVLATRDYIQKNKFKGALIGLSGGIDSALTTAIAVDAIGHENVHVVMMPSRYTSQISLDTAKAMADNLKLKYSIISIEPAFETLLKSLSVEFFGTAPGLTEENLQARIRGNILMALSNKFGKLVLSTGNKSEMATGYATLYGDMAGGFAILKDVYKTLVYQLSEYRNSISNIIPQEIIDRAPTAELKHDQKDQDTLPPYPLLDEILKHFIEQDKTIEKIVAQGFDEAVIRKVVAMITKNEYKRRQAPPGPKITTRAFGRERRYPITSGFEY